MGLDFTVFKGSKEGKIVEATSHREPGPTEVIVKISHSGVCGTDEHYRHSDLGLGHEGVGTIVEVGANVEESSEFKVGDRVGISYQSKFCGRCKQCVTGRQNMCPNAEYLGSGNFDQGCFGTGAAWDISAIYKIPDEIASEDAGPLLCGGATVWEALMRGNAQGGDRIGIVGVGGLGHLAIIFASKLGLVPVVFSSTESKREEALNFGAKEFYVTNDMDKLKDIEKLDMLIMTTNAVPDTPNFLPLLSKGAYLFPLTISWESLGLTPFALVSGALTVSGWTVAPIASMRAMLDFAAKNNVRAQIEKFPMTQEGVTEAMQKLRDGKVRYRGVLCVESA